MTDIVIAAHNFMRLFFLNYAALFPLVKEGALARFARAVFFAPVHRAIPLVVVEWAG
jgi:hypothetical protein